MSPRRLLERIALAALALVIALLLLGTTERMCAQAPGGGAASPTSAQKAAPKDLTGYWVSVVTEDWRWRMVVPIKGDFASVPLNPEGRKVASTWDPGQAASEDQCKAYGAAAIMRVPGRLHIYWQGDNTLRIDTDSGMQTRLLHFGESPTSTLAPELQGYSSASWEGIPPAGRGQAKPPGSDLKGYLKVVTTHMRAGYLRRNGIPYSANAILQEYVDRFSEPNGDIWLAATIIVTDPQYLTQPYVTHAVFKKLASNSGWDPTPCRAGEAR